MRLSHDPLRTHASFYDPNLVSLAGLVPVMALAERAGLAALVREHVSVAGPCGTSARARGAIIRRHLISVAARIARHGRSHITVHLPGGWHRERGWMTLFEAACRPPAASA